MHQKQHVTAPSQVGTCDTKNSTSQTQSRGNGTYSPYRGRFQKWRFPRFRETVYRRSYNEKVQTLVHDSFVLGVVTPTHMQVALWACFVFATDR